MSESHVFTQAKRRGRPTALVVLVAVSLVTTLFLYGSAPMSADYVHDDHPALLDNPLVRFPPPVAEIWTSPWFGPAPGYRTQGLSRPLVTFGYALEAGLDLNSSGRHLINLLLYALLSGVVGLMVWLVLAERTWRMSAALVTTLLFTLHPIHVSSVMCVSYRPELQAALFALLATCCLWAGVRKNSLLSLWAAPLLLLALWSKESAVTVLGAWTVWVSTQRSQRGWQAIGGAVLLCGAWLALRHSWIGSPWVSFHDNPLGDAQVPVRLTGALSLIHHAAAKLLWPTNLAPDETFGSLPVLKPAMEEVIAGASLVILLLSIGLTQWRKGLAGDRDAALRASAIAWFGGGWLPVSHLLFASTVLFADRLLFLPSIAALAGFAVLISTGLTNQGWRRAVARATLLLCALAWGVITNAEAQHWVSEKMLFARGVQVRPNNLRMRYNLGRLLLTEQAPEAAQAHLEAAWRIAPGKQETWTLLVQDYTQLKRCQKLKVLTDAPPKPTLNSHYQAMVDAGVACRRFGEAFDSGRAITKMSGQWPVKIYVAAVAAQHPDAQQWAQKFTDRPEESLQWVAAAMYAERLAGRPDRALSRLRRAAIRHPRKARIAAQRLCRQLPALARLCAEWPGVKAAR